jgi:hypothetical protein
MTTLKIIQKTDEAGNIRYILEMNGGQIGTSEDYQHIKEAFIIAKMCAIAKTQEVILETWEG